jgi:hypothetical protein
MKEYEYGRFKIFTEHALFKRWVVFIYRIRNGIIEAKEASNHFSTWRVIERIPSGAELI